MTWLYTCYLHVIYNSTDSRIRVVVPESKGGKYHETFIGPHRYSPVKVPLPWIGNDTELKDKAIKVMVEVDVPPETFPEQLREVCRLRGLTLPNREWKTKFKIGMNYWTNIVQFFRLGSDAAEGDSVSLNSIDNVDLEINNLGVIGWTAMEGKQSFWDWSAPENVYRRARLDQLHSDCTRLSETNADNFTRIKLANDDVREYLKTTLMEAPGDPIPERDLDSFLKENLISSSLNPERELTEFTMPGSEVIPELMVVALDLLVGGFVFSQRKLAAEYLIKYIPQKIISVETLNLPAREALKRVGNTAVRRLTSLFNLGGGDVAEEVFLEEDFVAFWNLVEAGGDEAEGAMVGVIRGSMTVGQTLATAGVALLVIGGTLAISHILYLVGEGNAKSKLQEYIKYWFVMRENLKYRSTLGESIAIALVGVKTNIIDYKTKNPEYSSEDLVRQTRALIDEATKSIMITSIEEIRNTYYLEDRLQERYMDDDPSYS